MACLLAKPVVDGIERELGDTRLVRINAMSRAGGIIAMGYGVRGVPTLIVFDGEGKIVLTQVGRLSKEPVLQAVRKL
ncbi:MAG: thioredoxin family protein [Chloroflexi bacterium]|nr:thioredoxin family protein [Chloroflexota bacterium]